MGLSLIYRIRKNYGWLSEGRSSKNAEAAATQGGNQKTVQFLCWRFFLLVYADGVDVDDVGHSSSIIIVSEKQNPIRSLPSPIHIHTKFGRCLVRNHIAATLKSSHNNDLYNTKLCGAYMRLRSFIYHLSTINQKSSICSRQVTKHCICLRHTQTE